MYLNIWQNNLPDSDHLTESKVASIADGTANPSDADRWLSHLEQCQMCARQYAAILDSSSTDARLREAMLTTDPYPEEAGFELLSSWISDGLAASPDQHHPDKTQLPRDIGNYKLIRVIGRGGMGVVHEARQRWLNRTVAIKLLRLDEVVDQSALHQFTREFEAVGRLDHPGIVRAIDAGCRHGQAFLVMELVEGLDLGKIRQRCGVLSEALVIEIGIGASEALAHAHQNGVIHRDVKPSNLMLGRDADGSGVRVRLMDLGLGQVESEMNPTLSSHVLAGTKGYRAPEQQQRSSDSDSSASVVDQRADIYALGATFLALATDLKRDQWSAAAAAESQHLSSGFRKLISAMLSASPDDRPGNMADIQQELQHLRSTGKSAGKPASLAALLASASAQSADGVSQATEFDQVTTDKAACETQVFPRRGMHRWIAAIVLTLATASIWILIAGLVPSGDQTNSTAKSKTPKSNVLIGNAEANRDGVSRSQPMVDLIPLSQRVANEVIRLGGTWECLSESGESLEFDSIESFPSFPVQMDWIMLSNSKANDETLELISGLPSLTGLVLSNTDVTDAGIKELSKLETLEKVYLYDTAITDDAVETLARLPRLATLIISVTEITNRSILTLEGCPSLSYLAIKDTRVNADCLESLGKLSNLEFLDLREIDLGGEDLSPLLNMKKMRTLELAQTNVGAAAMETLMTLPRLSKIVSDCDQISATEAKALIQKHPQVDLFRDPTE